MVLVHDPDSGEEYWIDEICCTCTHWSSDVTAFDTGTCDLFEQLRIMTEDDTCGAWNLWSQNGNQP